MSISSDKARSASKPWGTWLTIAATLAIIAICGTVVWYGFVVTPETNCIILVTGDKDLDGSTVEVVPKVAADPDRALLTVKLTAQNEYSARFFLNSGTYQVRLLRPDGSAAIDVTDFVPPGRRWTYDLTHRKPGLGQAPATRVTSLR